jgi:hypothetical protein
MRHDDPGSRIVGYYLLDHPSPTGPNYYPTRRSPLLAIVVHCTAGLQDLDLIGPDNSAEGTARYAATTDRDVSWHSGSDSDTWVDLLPYSYTAWQCQGYNSSTAGHEISKRDMVWADEPADWVTRTLTIAARGLATRAREHRIPLRRATRAELDRAIANGGPPVGFVTHAELDPARRTDPGADFPWTRFLGLMAGTTPIQEDISIVDAATKTYFDRQFAVLTAKIQATGGRLADVQAEVSDDETDLTAAIGGAKDAILGELESAGQPTGVWYVQQIGRAEVYEVISGRARHVTAAEWAARSLSGTPVVRLDPAADAALLGQLGIATQSATAG